MKLRWLGPGGLPAILGIGHALLLPGIIETIETEKQPTVQWVYAGA